MEEVKILNRKDLHGREKAQLGLDRRMAQSDDTSYFHIKYEILEPT